MANMRARSNSTTQIRAVASGALRQLLSRSSTPAPSEADFAVRSLPTPPSPQQKQQQPPLPPLPLAKARSRPGPSPSRGSSAGGDDFFVDGRVSAASAPPFPPPTPPLTEAPTAAAIMPRDDPLPPLPSLQQQQQRFDAEAAAAVAAALPPLQVSGGDPEGLEPLAEEDYEPGSFDLVQPSSAASGTGSPSRQPAEGARVGVHPLERRSDLLFSRPHLHVIFDDPALLQRFTNFLYAERPGSVPLLTYYLEALKALRAVAYSNAVVRRLVPLAGYGFTHGAAQQAGPSDNAVLRAKADAAFDLLSRDDLPAYVTHTWIQTVTVSIRRRIAGTLPPHLRDLSEGLAEVFCLTDPSRPDNPIVFASEEFHRTTQYGDSYVIGRNCRFLQGPHTNPFSVRRIREKIEAGVEHYETFLNYRRDGSPFMNLLMCAPLYDSRGQIRYFIGAQVDVSGLVKEGYGLESFQRLADSSPDGVTAAAAAGNDDRAGIDEFGRLAEILNRNELETVRRHGGSLHRPHMSGAGAAHPRLNGGGGTGADADADAGQAIGEGPNWHRHRLVIRDPDSPSGEEAGRRGDGLAPSSLPVFSSSLQPGRNPAGTSQSIPTASTLTPLADRGGRLKGVYEHYLLVRPYPSLRILFASPSLRVPGILQSPLLNRIGGSERVKAELEQALAYGQGVTAKVKWVPLQRKTGLMGMGAARQQQQRRRRQLLLQQQQQQQQRRGDFHPLEVRYGLEVSGSGDGEGGGGGGGGDDDDYDDPYFVGPDGGYVTPAAPPPGRSRWLHCTPLHGSNGKVGVWMVVVVDDEPPPDGQAARARIVRIVSGPGSETAKTNGYGHNTHTLQASPSISRTAANGHQHHQHPQQPAVCTRRSTDTLDGQLPAASSSSPSQRRPPRPAPPVLDHPHPLRASPFPGSSSSSIPQAQLLHGLYHHDQQQQQQQQHHQAVGHYLSAGSGRSTPLVATSVAAHGTDGYFHRGSGLSSSQLIGAAPPVPLPPPPPPPPPPRGRRMTARSEISTLADNHMTVSPRRARSRYGVEERDAAEKFAPVENGRGCEVEPEEEADFGDLEEGEVESLISRGESAYTVRIDDE